MIQVIPAILPHHFEDLTEHLGAVRSLSRAVQIDVVDGIFAPNRTWPYTDAASFERILSEEEGMPFWEDFDFELDLMVEKSKDAALQWVRAGASRIIIHAESPDDKAALVALQEYREGEGAIDVGVAISPLTPDEKLESLIEYVSFIQVMGIEKVGFQGSPQWDGTAGRVHALREKYPGTLISVDGGVTLGTARTLADAGASRLVVGSGVFAHNPKEALREFADVLS